MYQIDQVNNNHNPTLQQISKSLKKQPFCGTSRLRLISLHLLTATEFLKATYLNFIIILKIMSYFNSGLHSSSSLKSCCATHFCVLVSRSQSGLATSCQTRLELLLVNKYFPIEFLQQVSNRNFSMWSDFVMHENYPTT